MKAAVLFFVLLSLSFHKRAEFFDPQIRDEICLQAAILSATCGIYRKVDLGLPVYAAIRRDAMKRMPMLQGCYGDEAFHSLLYGERLLMGNYRIQARDIPRIAWKLYLYTDC